MTRPFFSKVSMPIAPKNPFRKFTCLACGWSIVTYQPSDAMYRPYVCQKCGGKQLDLSTAGAIESFQAYPKQFLKRLL